MKAAISTLMKVLIDSYHSYNEKIEQISELTGRFERQKDSYMNTLRHYESCKDEVHIRIAEILEALSSLKVPTEDITKAVGTLNGHEIANMISTKPE